MAATTKPIVFALPENYVCVETNGTPMADGAAIQLANIRPLAGHQDMV